MKKWIALILATLLLALTLASCGNYDYFDTNYTFDYAIVSFPDGSVETIPLKSWTDYEGEQIQLIAEDGRILLVNSVNCILVNDPD
ncbi:MAG: hypothetical protein IJW92_02195 [Clostridia bacterium]|nr:hypothetical protein [Clostridia bacterium]